MWIRVARLLVTIAACAAVAADQDPCLPGCHTELSDPHRSAASTVQYPLQPLCDISLPSGWYRFTNGMMPETCVSRFHCGTIVPVWLSGGHPTISEGIVTRKACANFETGEEGQTDPCCEHSLQIAVKNCWGDYYVYYLQPTPSCPIAYCAGSKEPCPAGQWSPDGFLPCKDTFPKFDTSPVLQGPEVTNNSFRFACQINTTNHEPDQMFQVVWTFDGREDPAITPTVLKDTDRVAYLPGSQLKGHMGTNVGCKVRSFYSGSNFTSPWLPSNTYWAGIRTDPPRLTISEKEELRNVTLTSTIPIVCDHNYTCCITIKLDVDGPKNNLVTAHKCTYEICKEDWNPATHTASVTVPLVASKDLITDGNKDLLLSFENILSAGGGGYLSAFDGYRLTPTQIDVQDVPTKSCVWAGDPHIHGLESRGSFDLFKIGDYTMYENPKRDFEMQVRTWPCNGHVSCACAVIIREKNDVIRIDECDQPYGGRHTSPRVVVYSRPLREGTVIQRSTDGNQVTVNLPSSTEVKVEAHPYGLDVHMIAPAVDAGEGRGVCGTFDNNPNNEFTHRDGHVDRVCSNCRPDSFTESWKNNASTSLFESLPPKVTDSYEANYCKCDSGMAGTAMATCGPREDIPNTVMGCQICSNITGTAPVFDPKSLGGWTKRSSAAIYVDHDEPDSRFNPNDYKDFQPGNPTWPTPSGITQQQATAKCLEALRGSQLWTHCQNSQQVVDNYLQDCLTDALFVDGFSFLEGTVASFTTECQIELSKDPNNYVTSTGGKIMMKPELSSDLCSVTCLRHGRCDKGRCICDSGYTGDNCNLLAVLGPQLARIRNSNACDVNERPCRKIFIDVTNIALTDQLACKVQEVLPDGSLSREVFIQESHFLTAGRLACSLPEARIKSETSVRYYLISATNDGRLYGNQLNVTVYDSKCQACSEGTCHPKNTACLINNLCYEDGDKNPANANEVCQVSYSTTQWKNLQSASARFPAMVAPTLTGPDSDYIMTCTVHSDDVSSAARFEVTWYVDDQRQNSETLYGAAREATYSLLDLPSNNGKIYCMVRAFYTVGEFSGYLTSGPALVQKPA